VWVPAGRIDQFSLNVFLPKSLNVLKTQCRFECTSFLFFEKNPVLAAAAGGDPHLVTVDNKMLLRSPQADIQVRMSSVGKYASFISQVSCERFVTGFVKSIFKFSRVSISQLLHTRHSFSLFTLPSKKSAKLISTCGFRLLFFAVVCAVVQPF